MKDLSLKKIIIGIFAISGLLIGTSYEARASCFPCNVNTSNTSYNDQHNQPWATCVGTSGQTDTDCQTYFDETIEYCGSATTDPEYGNGCTECSDCMAQCQATNTNFTKYCDSWCSDAGCPICSNNTIEPGEQCDDGNLTNGDGCNSSCQNEAPVTPEPSPQVFIGKTVYEGLDVATNTFYNDFMVGTGNVDNIMPVLKRTPSNQSSTGFNLKIIPASVNAQAEELQVGDLRGLIANYPNPKIGTSGWCAASKTAGFGCREMAKIAWGGAGCAQSTQIDGGGNSTIGCCNSANGCVCKLQSQGAPTAAQLSATPDGIYSTGTTSDPLKCYAR